MSLSSARTPSSPLRVLAIGAHPDDCEIRFGGTASKYAAAGHQVRFVSATDGGAGHHELSGDELVDRRRAESETAADVLGVESAVLDNPDGRLTASIDRREEVIELLRSYRPDLVFTHRPNDYHPDHRATAELVRDAAYLVTVPNVCPDTPHLEYSPVVCYLADDFRKPAPFEPDVAVAIDDVLETKLDALECHESQVYEWLPANANDLGEVPENETQRREWLVDRWMPRFDADRFREALHERYGEDRAAEISCAEAFEVSEYGGEVTDENRNELFPVR